MVGRTLATIYKNGAVFDLVTDSLKMTIYHDRKTVPPLKCSFKPSLEFNMMNTAFVTSTAF